VDILHSFSEKIEIRRYQDDALHLLITEWHFIRSAMGWEVTKT
jgi:hypothetical protein